MRPTAPARALAALIAAMALAALVIQYTVLRGEFDYGPPRTLWVMARYLTILTNALVAVSFAALALGLSPGRPRWFAGLLLWMALVAGGYHLLLRQTAEIAGIEIWSDLAFHTLVPALVAIHWLLFAPKGHLTLGDVPFFLSWPVIYVSYALTRGGISGVFPYPFLDPSLIGWEPVLWTIGRLGLGLLVLALLVIGLDRVLARVLDRVFG